MDTSETYIKMCEKAVEIQKLKISDSPVVDKWYTGDICFIPHDDPDAFDSAYYKGVYTIWNGLIPNSGYHDWDSYWCGPPNDAIWLPCQDQLQEMINEKYKTERIVSFIMVTDFLAWFKDNMESYLVNFSSMEQFWLAFTMQHLYNKIWNGEEWHLVQI